ncbi:MAG TPA: alpha/beta hydrolase-fold protein [Chloroflexota bacterium]|nr:alpha/beta hydrolase-fold protein [Chloroflexota bacterium]
MRLTALLSGTGTKAAAVVLLLSIAWAMTLARPGKAPPRTAAEPSDTAFQPVPNTSPVPNKFQVATAPRAASPMGAALPGKGSRTEFYLFESKALNRTMHYLAYEPAGYELQPGQRYPVLYLLHGMGAGLGGPSGYETEWPGYGMLATADDLIATGQIPPLLIVMPEGDQSYWIDQAGSGGRYGTYVSDDLVSEIDGRFRTEPDRAHRAIGGLSMGGFGALSIAMLRPDVFGTAGAHSPSLVHRDRGPAFFGDAAYFAAHDPVQLLRDHPATARSLRLWLDVAADDPLWKADTEALHRQLLSEGVPHEWHEWAGQHDGLYWNAHLNDYLGFYVAALNSSSQALLTHVPTD